MIITLKGFPRPTTYLGVLAGESQFLMFFICTVIFLIIGCFLDTGSAALLLTPIVLPAVIPLGIDPVHFALVMIIALIIGAITPPFGLCLFVVADVGNVPVKRVTVEALKYLPAMIFALILVIIFPELVTWLPKVLLN